MAKTNPARAISRATLISALFGLSALAAGQDSPSGGASAEGVTARGHTAPYEKRAQNFDLPGVVRKLLVKEGDVVKKGQLLAEQNLGPDEKHLESLKLAITSAKLEIEAEQATLAKDQHEFERNKKLRDTNSISTSEYETSKLSVDVDEKKVAHAQADELKAHSDVAEQEARIEQKRLYSAIDGVVSEISTHEGELTNTDAQHPTVTIVNNTPLLVEADLPAEVVRELKKPTWKQPLLVQYFDEGYKGAWREAKIKFIKPEADSKSNTEHVQLEMLNPEGRSSGLRVIVRVPTAGMQMGAVNQNQ